jgi:hypothetical protein
VSAADTLPRFDGPGVWVALPLEHQAAFGQAALELVVAWMGQDAAADPHEARLFIAAEDAARDFLVQLADDILPAISQSQDPIPVPSILGPFCRVCHCSQHDCCPRGCGWAEPDLCTACVAVNDASTGGSPQVDAGSAPHG